MVDAYETISVFEDREARRRNDIETMYGETLFGPMRTPTEFVYDPIDLSIRGKEDGQNIQTYLKNAVIHAQKLAKTPEYAFYLRRCQAELQEGRDLVDFMDDDSVNVKIVVSDFPAELMEKSGSVANFDCDRKQAYLRVYTKNGDVLHMYSQSLDKSDRAGLEQIYTYMGVQPQQGELLSQRLDSHIDDRLLPTIIDTLTHVYDSYLYQKIGVYHYAGMPVTGKVINTYTFAKQQQDIIGLALSYDRQGLLNQERNYNLMSLLRERYQLAKQNSAVVEVFPQQSLAGLAVQYAILEQKSMQAGEKARSEGVEYRACGMAVRGNPTTQDRLDGAGFTKDTAEDKFGPLDFQCPKGHWNTRPRNKLIDKCKTCKVSVKC